MTWDDPLITYLLDFLFELEKNGLKTPLIIAGGFGLFLKRRYLAERQERTLFSNMPGARSTEDIDIFAQRNTLCDIQQAQSIKDALSRLQYEVIEAEKYMQWKKTINIGTQTGTIKIDFLVGNVDAYRSYLHIEQGRNPRRARHPRVEGFHARITKEALLIDEKAQKIPLSGIRTSGETHDTTICVPHPFTYLLMKLFAFRDRQEKLQKQQTQYHAFDIFLIIGLLTESELHEAIEFGKHYAEEPIVQEAKRIIADHFTGTPSDGMVAIKSHPSFSANFEAKHYSEFEQILMEVFNGEPTRKN